MHHRRWMADGRTPAGGAVRSAVSVGADGAAESVAQKLNDPPLVLSEGQTELGSAERLVDGSLSNGVAGWIAGGLVWPSGSSEAHGAISFPV